MRALTHSLTWSESAFIDRSQLCDSSSQTCLFLFFWISFRTIIPLLAFKFAHSHTHTSIDPTQYIYICTCIRKYTLQMPQDFDSSALTNVHTLTHTTRQSEKRKGNKSIQNNIAHWQGKMGAEKMMSSEPEKNQSPNEIMPRRLCFALVYRTVCAVYICD